MWHLRKIGWKYIKAVVRVQWLFSSFYSSVFPATRKWLYITLYTINVIYDSEHWDLQRLWIMYKVSMSLRCLLICCSLLPFISMDDECALHFYSGFPPLNVCMKDIFGCFFTCKIKLHELRVLSARGPEWMDNMSKDRWMDKQIVVDP